MVDCRTLSRKQVPEPERTAISQEIRRLLSERDDDGKRVWSQESLGAAAGGLSQESIRRALKPSGVGPAVRDGILKVLGVTMDGLLGQASEPPHKRVRTVRVTKIVRRPDPRYNHREEAMRILVDGGEGTEAEVRAAADAAGVALEAHEDPPVIEWIDTIRLELRRQRKGRPELRRRTATDEDFEG